jgi:hypothetical protein
MFPSASVDDLVDLLSEDQSGQMEHGADADTGPQVGGAGGEVAEFPVEGVVEVGLELGVERVDVGPGLAELETRQESLHAQMVLLVDHHAERFGPVEDDPGTLALGRVLPADHVPFDQYLLVEGRKILHRV